MVDIKKLSVSTDEEREGWVQLLETAIAYHWDMSGEFQPEIKTPKGMISVSCPSCSKIHTVDENTSKFICSCGRRIRV